MSKQPGLLGHFVLQAGPRLFFSDSEGLLLDSIYLLYARSNERGNFCNPAS